MDYRRLKEALEGFIERDHQDYPEEVDELIRDTARTGAVRLPWELLKPLLHYRLEEVLNSSFLWPHTEDDEMSQQVLDQLNKFDGPPFTIQRLCELIAEPHKHYKKRDTFMRAVEKNLLVVSTQEPDLTWMKSPRLAQLLEERPKPTEGKKYPLSEKQPVMAQAEAAQSTGSPPSTTSTWTNLREISGENPRDLKPMSEPCSVHVEGSAVASSLRLSPGGGGLVSRKRSSSLRDSMEEDSETVTVLQEADSTVDIEQSPVEESLEEISPKKVKDSSNNSDASPLKSLLERRALPTPDDSLTDSGHIEGAHSENNAANSNNGQTELKQVSSDTVVEEMDTN